MDLICVFCLPGEYGLIEGVIAKRGVIIPIFVNDACEIVAVKWIFIKILPYLRP